MRLPMLPLAVVLLLVAMPAQAVIPAPAMTLTFVHNDHLGTPVAMTDTSGTVVWRATKKPFGETTVDEDPDGDGQPATLNIRFPGQYFDAETGMHYNWHRDYAPGIGRYIESDPIGLHGGINIYQYSNANSINNIDPWGLIWITTGYDYHGVKNWSRWFFNRWVSQIGKGMDPTFPGSDPDELVELERDVIQEWRSDSNNKCRDSEYPLRTKRRIPQTYNKFINHGPDRVLINNPDDDFYFQWKPWVNSPTYDNYKNTK